MQCSDAPPPSCTRTMRSLFALTYTPLSLLGGAGFVSSLFLSIGSVPLSFCCRAVITLMWG